MAVYVLGLSGCTQEPWNRVSTPFAPSTTPEIAFNNFKAAASGRLGEDAFKYLTPEARGDLMFEMLQNLVQIKSREDVGSFFKKHQVDKVSFSFGPSPTDLNLARVGIRSRISHIKDADGFLKDILSFPGTIRGVTDATGLDGLTITGNDAVANVKGVRSRTVVAERIRMRFKKTPNGWLIDTTPWWYPNGD